MGQSNAGSFRLMQVFGINVFIHWSWFVVAVLQIQAGKDRYQAPFWPIAEYLTLFGIVLLHEFGHALACRSVGGKADRIVLWPLGGIAFVMPPPRPGPVLWSITAGPLVNLVLVPVTVVLLLATGVSFFTPQSDLDRYLIFVFVLNIGLFIFNMLPIYPLDGGQILQSLLWFLMGRWQSLQVVSILGVLAGGMALMLALVGAMFFGGGVLWLGLIAVFVLYRSVMGFQQSRALLQLQELPRYEHLRCPACGEAAPQGLGLNCPRCKTGFEPLATHAICPGCGSWFDEVPCVYCGHASTPEAWAGKEAVGKELGPG